MVKRMIALGIIKKKLNYFIVDFMIFLDGSILLENIQTFLGEFKNDTREMIYQIIYMN